MMMDSPPFISSFGSSSPISLRPTSPSDTFSPSISPLLTPPTRHQPMSPRGMSPKLFHSTRRKSPRTLAIARSPSPPSPLPSHSRSLIGSDFLSLRTPPTRPVDRSSQSSFSSSSTSKDYEKGEKGASTSLLSTPSSSPCLSPSHRAGFSRLMTPTFSLPSPTLPSLLMHPIEMRSPAVLPESFASTLRTPTPTTDLKELNHVLRSPSLSPTGASISPSPSLTAEDLEHKSDHENHTEGGGVRVSRSLSSLNSLLNFESETSSSLSLSSSSFSSSEMSQTLIDIESGPDSPPSTTGHTVLSILGKSKKSHFLLGGGPPIAMSSPPKSTKRKREDSPSDTKPNSLLPFTSSSSSASSASQLDSSSTEEANQEMGERGPMADIAISESEGALGTEDLSDPHTSESADEEDSDLESKVKNSRAMLSLPQCTPPLSAVKPLASLTNMDTSKKKQVDKGDASPDSPVSSPEVPSRRRRFRQNPNSSPINQKLMDPSSMSPATSVAAGIVFFPNILELHLSGFTLPLSPRSEAHQAGESAAPTTNSHYYSSPSPDHKSEVRVTQIHERTERSLLDHNQHHPLFSQTAFLQQHQQYAQPECNSQLILSGMESVTGGLVGGTEAHMQSMPIQYDYPGSDYAAYNTFPEYSQSMEQMHMQQHTHQIDPSQTSVLYPQHPQNEIMGPTGIPSVDLTQDPTPLPGLNPPHPHHQLIDLSNSSDLSELPPALYSHHGYWPPPTQQPTGMEGDGSITINDSLSHALPPPTNYEHYYSAPNPSQTQTQLPALTDAQLLDPGMPLSAAVVLSQVAAASLGDHLSEHQPYSL